MMAGGARLVMRLLLFCALASAAKGEYPLIFDKRRYDIAFPCEEDYVCFHVWRLSMRVIDDDVVVVTNGNLQSAESGEGGSTCILPFKHYADEDYYHACHKNSEDSSPYSSLSATPELTLLPGKSVSLQCVLLSSVSLGHCSPQFQQVSLTWLDEAGAPIRGDLGRRIKRRSRCDTTLTVAFQSPGNRKFSCRVTVDGEVQRAVELWVRVPAMKGRGRGLIIEEQPEEERGEEEEEEEEEEGGGAGKQDVAGPAVGVLACVVLTGLVAAFAARRRRMRLRRSDESLSTSNNAAANADDVIYADVFLPDGSGQVRRHESTEYACIRHK